ncbi:MAG: hypothetical protein ACRD40_06040 [Candidatus Acidiferrales bacterium]
MRSYTVTTGVWLGAILADDCDVNINGIRWVTFEDPHVTEYEDSEIVERAPSGKQMLQMLLKGSLTRLFLAARFQSSASKP